MPKTFTASGNNQKCDVTVEGLGKARVEISFDDTNTIISIVFNGERPSLTKDILTRLKPKDNQERCHEKSVEWIKESIIAEFTGKKCKDVKRGYKLAINLKDATFIIATLYLDKIREGKNLFLGDKLHNNFAGKLAMLLKPYVSKRKEVFEKENKGIITIPRINFANDPDFYRLIREFFGSESIDVDSWDMLLELYFGANFDETKVERKDIFKFMESSSTSSSTSSPKRDSFCQATAEFLNIYQRYGEYTWQPSMFKSSTSTSTKNTSGITFDNAVKLIKSKQLFSIDDLAFNINDSFKISSGETYKESHTSSQNDNQYFIYYEATILHVAAQEGNLPVFQKLLDKGANLSAPRKILHIHSHSELIGGRPDTMGEQWSEPTETIEGESFQYIEEIATKEIMEEIELRKLGHTKRLKTC